MEAPPTVGQLLREVRINNKITQEAIAEIFGVSPENVAAIEMCRRRMPQRHLGVLSKAIHGVDEKKFRAAIEREASPLMIKNVDAVERFSGVIAGNKGKVAVINGLGSDFPSKQMLESWSNYLQTNGAQVDFIQPDATDGAFTSQSCTGGLGTIQKTIAKGNADAATRVNFYSLVPPENIPPEHAGKAGALSRLLHPLTATILFEPEQDAELRAGLTYMRTGLERAGKGEFVWMRPTSKFLEQLSSLLKATLWSQSRNSLLMATATE
jgi:hypothetical protein